MIETLASDAPPPTSSLTSSQSAFLAFRCIRTRRPETKREGTERNATGLDDVDTKVANYTSVHIYSFVRSCINVYSFVFIHPFGSARCPSMPLSGLDPGPDNGKPKPGPPGRRPMWWLALDRAASPSAYSGVAFPLLYCKEPENIYQLLKVTAPLVAKTIVPFIFSCACLLMWSFCRMGVPLRLMCFDSCCIAPTNAHQTKLFYGAEHCEEELLLVIPCFW